MSPVERALRVVGVLLFVLYPPLVWYALSSGSPRAAAAWLLVVAVPLALLALRRRAARVARTLGVLPFVTLAALGLTALFDTAEFVLVVPAVVNALFLLSFGSTLRAGNTPMIERFARLQLTDPTAAQLAWCRMWTWIWCGFFAVNGATAALLAWLAPLRVWALYCGFLAYVASGVMFAVEYVLRRRRFG